MRRYKAINRNMRKSLCLSKFPVCNVNLISERQEKGMFMSNTVDDKSVIRNIILESQHLRNKSSESIENIVSDICGLQYDPNPTIHLNQYMMLWNRKRQISRKPALNTRSDRSMNTVHLESMESICTL